jgi:hypothetical protein
MAKAKKTSAVPSTHVIVAYSSVCFGVRQQEVHGGRVVVRDAVLFETLDGARHWCAQLGLVSQGRLEQDDPLIVEVWS